MRIIAKKCKGLALALVLTVVCAAFVPVTADAAVSYPKEQTLYMTSTSGNSYLSFYVGGLKKSETIGKSSVKSSDKKICAPWYLERATSTYSYKTQYYDGQKPYSSSSSSYGYYIGLQAKKTGTAKISFKVGSKTYTSKVKFKKYTNPLKTVKISGVNNGNNVASKLKNSNYCSTLKLTKTTKNATVTVKPNSGWKVQSIEVYNGQTGDTIRVSNYGTKGVSNATLNVGTLKAKSYLRVYITCVDSNGTSLSCNYYINN